MSRFVKDLLVIGAATILIFGVALIAIGLTNFVAQWLRHLL